MDKVPDFFDGGIRAAQEPPHTQKSVHRTWVPANTAHR